MVAVDCCSFRPTGLSVSKGESPGHASLVVSFPVPDAVQRLLIGQADSTLLTWQDIER